MLRLSLALAACLVAVPAARADLIFTYQWVSTTGDPFAGSFSVESRRLAAAPSGNLLLDAAGIVHSEFSYNGGPPFTVSPRLFPVAGFSPGLEIHPETGAVLSGGSVLFGEGALVADSLAPGRLASIAGGQATLDTAFSVPGTQRAALVELIVAPGFDPFTRDVPAVSGSWRLEARAIPAPPSLALFAAGAVGLLAARRFLQKSSSSSSSSKSSGPSEAGDAAGDGRAGNSHC